MKTYISLLRGINVSGHKIIKMADLKLLYEELGFKNVQTYIQSGNVIFEGKQTPTIELQELIFNKIKDHYGFEVPNLILTPEEIKEASDNNPYQEIEKMYFTFLSENPLQENLNTFNSFNFDDEYYQLIGNVMYYYCPKGYAKAKMTNQFIEKKLKVRATTRNLNTVNKLINLTTFMSN